MTNPAHHSALSLFFLAFSPSTAGTPFCPASRPPKGTEKYSRQRLTTRITNGPNPAQTLGRFFFAVPSLPRSLIQFPLSPFRWDIWRSHDTVLANAKCQVSNSSHHCPGGRLVGGPWTMLCLRILWEIMGVSGKDGPSEVS